MPRLRRPRRRGEPSASEPLSVGGQHDVVIDQPLRRQQPGASTSLSDTAYAGTCNDDLIRRAAPRGQQHANPGTGSSALAIVFGHYFGGVRPFAAVSLSDWQPPKLPAWPSQLGASLKQWGGRWQFPAPLWVMLAPPGQPDKRRLMSVQEFFNYTEDSGRRFFNQLDRDGDGRVTLDDVRTALRRVNLPEAYATDFLAAARGTRWWKTSLTWQDFKGVMDEKEPAVLRAFTSMEVAPSGLLELNSIKGSLMAMGLPATDETAKAMLKALGGESDGFVSYGKFRNFALLLPDAKLRGDDPAACWMEAATMLPLGPPRDSGAGTGAFLLKAALAGGIASGTSTFLLHPIDTCKTRIQSTPGATILSVVRSVPSIGAKSLYRGIIPATTGTFVGHGVRTFAYEASLKLFSSLAGGAAELQAQGLASGVGTLLGTSIRIPCEVMKQRLQVGRQANVVAAFQAATATEGVRGLFRGTAATLSREVPFYVLGMVGYQQLKKVARGEAFGGRGRELAPWETIALGFVSGALAAVLTTPGDVMKTRIMTAPADQAVNAGAILVGIVREEGVGALFKGALPRVLWTAPQGAMNFAGYELAKRALTGGEGEALKKQLEAEEAQPAKSRSAQPSKQPAPAAAQRSTNHTPTAGHGRMAAQEPKQKGEPLGARPQLRFGGAALPVSQPSTAT